MATSTTPRTNQDAIFSKGELGVDLVPTWRPSVRAVRARSEELRAHNNVQHFWHPPCPPAKPHCSSDSRKAAKTVCRPVRRSTAPVSDAPSIVRQREHPERAAGADAVHLAAAARRRDGRARGARAKISARLRRARPARRAPRPRAIAVAVAQPQPDPPRRAADDGLGRGRRARLRDGARVAAAPPEAPRAARAEREASAHRGESSPGALPASHGIVGRRRSRPDPPRGPVRKSTSASGRSGGIIYYSGRLDAARERLVSSHEASYSPKRLISAQAPTRGAPLAAPHARSRPLSAWRAATALA